MTSSKTSADPKKAMDEVMNIGNEILQTPDDAVVLTLGEKFADCCEKILDSNFPWEEAQLETFSCLHSNVMKRVGHALDDTKSALRENQKRGKGIKSYATSGVNAALAKHGQILRKKKI